MADAKLTVSLTETRPFRRLVDDLRDDLYEDA